MSRRQSVVWYHFSEKETNRAECKYCKSIISIVGGSTGNLTRHLKRRHPTVPLERTSRPRLSGRSESEDTRPSTSVSPRPPSTSSCEVGEVCSLTDQPSTNIRTPIPTPPLFSSSLKLSQASVDSFVQVVKPVALSRSKAIDAQLLKMICKEFQPFSLVENPEFITFVNMLCPGYSLPSRKTLSRSLLPQTYNNLVEEIKIKLKSAYAVSITTDGWTSINNQSFLAITAHYIDASSSILCSNLLGCIEFNETRTASNLGAFLFQECKRWEIEQKITAAVTDNAPNIVAAVKCNNWRHVPCFAHTLNLIVKAGLKPIDPIVDKVKGVVQFFKKSPHSLNKLHETQKQLGFPELKLKQDVPTRWNSTYDMLQRVFQNKDPLLSTLAVLGNDSFKLNNEEWVVIAQALSLLKVFYDLTNEISSEKTVSLSKSFLLAWNLNSFLINKLKDPNLHPVVRNMTTIFNQETEKRFLINEPWNIGPESALLDPRFKKKSFKHCPPKYSQVYEKLVGQIKGQIISLRTHEAVESRDQVKAPKGESVLWEEFDEEVAGEPSIRDPKAMAIVELDKFLMEPLLERHEDPLAWWDQRKTIYPHLYRVVLKRLCIPASSVPCERVFSKAGQILTEKRCRLGASKLSQILFLNNNF